MYEINIPAVIMNESEDIVYLADIESYALKYINPAAKKRYGLAGEGDYIGKPCYEILQNRKSPCDFCTNNILRKDKFHVWNHYNSFINRYFLLKDKLIYIDGRPTRLEICVDITENELVKQDIQNELSEEQTLVKCIDTLKNGQDIDTAIDSLLFHIGTFYKADRAYIFESDLENSVLKNTYEWCKEAVEPQIGGLQKVPIEAAGRWMKHFEKGESVLITKVDEDMDKKSIEYGLLKMQGIQCLIAAPLKNVEGDTLGFIGVDNPSVNKESVHLLSSVSNFILDDLEKRRLLAQLEKMSYVDALTGTHNRNKYIQRIHELQKNPPQKLGVAYVDINGLKIANDTYGHQYGDSLIVRAAEHLYSVFRDNVYRIGGDEFVVLCVGIDKDEFERMGEELKKIVEGDEECSLSIGVKWDVGRTDAIEQIIRADELMYTDKQSYYSSMMTVKSKRSRYSFSKELVKAINNGEYEVFLQPKVEFKTMEVIGAEALIRKVGRNGDFIAPHNFIPLFEEEEVVCHVDLFVLETICQTLKKWQDEGIRLIKIAVNFSLVTLMEPGIVDRIIYICNSYGIPPRFIMFEVYENRTNMDLGNNYMAMIEKIADEGFSIALDGFGPQYSNMSILTSIDFEELILDKRLVDNIEKSEKTRTVIKYAVDMAKALNGARPVAKNIETQQQCDLLNELMCENGQGYYFSKPIPICEFQERFMTGKQKIVFDMEKSRKISGEQGSTVNQNQ